MQKEIIKNRALPEAQVSGIVTAPLGAGQPLGDFFKRKEVRRMSYYEKYNHDVHGFFFIKGGSPVCLKCGLKILEILGLADREVDEDKDEIGTISQENITVSKPILKCDFCGKRIS
jgi:hypothetical protein